jgi:hypothetical protein
MPGNNIRNLPIKLSLSQTNRNSMFLLISFMFFLLQNQKTGVWNRFCPEVREEGSGKGGGEK